MPLCAKEKCHCECQVPQRGTNLANAYLARQTIRPELMLLPLRCVTEMVGPSGAKHLGLPLHITTHVYRAPKVGNTLCGLTSSASTPTFNIEATALPVFALDNVPPGAGQHAHPEHCEHT